MLHRNNNLSVKRQRTRSRSASPPIEKAENMDGDASDDEAEARNGSKKTKSNRHQREKSEKDDKDRQRQEAASKRKGRAERRRAEGIIMLSSKTFSTSFLTFSFFFPFFSRLGSFGRECFGIFQNSATETYGVANQRKITFTRSSSGYSAHDPSYKR